MYLYNQNYKYSTNFNVCFKVPRACVGYGSNVNGYFTINPEQKSGSSTKFHALCKNGK